MSKKNLILLANYFCVNEEWLASGEGERDAPGIVKDTLIHDSSLHSRFVQIAQKLYGDNDNNVSIDIETMSTYTDIPQDRIYNIIYDNQFPSYTEIISLLKSDRKIDANWLILGVGNMYKNSIVIKEQERINKLVDTIATLQDTINAKNDVIATLSNRVMQLEKISNPKTQSL